MKIRQKLYFTIFFVLFLNIILMFSALAITPDYFNGKTLSTYGGVEFPDTTGKSISVYNVENNFMIYEKNRDEKVYPASTVKIMTAIIAYEKITDKTVPITVTKKVVNESTGLKLGLKEGDIYTAEDLIRAVLVCGSNDCANQLADYVSEGNKDNFIRMMNEKAAEIGCTSTRYTNVTGLHDENMYTTASDLLKIAIYAYGLGDLAEWSSSTSYTFTPLKTPDNYKLRYNRNDFISKSSTSKYYYKNAYGLNSGFTPEAGNCLITAASRNGMTYICVIMNSPAIEDDDTNYAYKDAKNLLECCFNKFESKKILDINSVISEVPLKLSANKDHVSLFPENQITHLLPTEISEEDLTFEKIIFSEEYSAPISKGDVFGELIVKYKNDYIIGRSNLITNEDFERSPVLFAIDKIKDFITGSFFIVSVITAILLFIIYTAVTLKKRRSGYWY